MLPGVGTHRYAYAGQDPVNARDPGGNTAENPTLADNIINWVGSLMESIRPSQSLQRDGFANAVQNTANVMVPGLGQYNQALKSVQQGDYTGAALQGTASLGDIALTYTGLKYIGMGASAAAEVVITGAERSAVTGTAVAIIPHGNSLTSVVPQTLYNILPIGGGTIQKIGIAGTPILQSRYSAAALAAARVALVPVMRATNRLEAVAIERAALNAYRQLNGGASPPSQINFLRGPF